MSQHDDVYEHCKIEHQIISFLYKFRKKIVKRIFLIILNE